MRLAIAVVLAAGAFAASAAAQNGTNGNAASPCGNQTITYVPAKVQTCAHGRCWWHDPAPSQAYLFVDPLVCFGANCPPGTMKSATEMR
jgi:hypothetical protein